MTWLTFEQFQKLGKKCDKCDKPAKWLSSGKDWPCYCDEHYPFVKEEDRRSAKTLITN